MERWLGWKARRVCVTQCDQIGPSLKVLGNLLSYRKQQPKYLVTFFDYFFKKPYFLRKNVLRLLLGNFWKNWATFSCQHLVTLCVCVFAWLQGRQRVSASAWSGQREREIFCLNVLFCVFIWVFSVNSFGLVFYLDCIFNVNVCRWLCTRLLFQSRCVWVSASLEREREKREKERFQPMSSSHGMYMKGHFALLGLPTLAFKRKRPTPLAQGHGVFVHAPFLPSFAPAHLQRCNI